MSFIATIEAELAGVRSRIVMLRSEEADLEATLRVLARLGGDTESTAARKDVRDNTNGPGVRATTADLAAGTTQPADTQAPPVDTHHPQPASPAGLLGASASGSETLATDKSGGAAGAASPAPSNQMHGSSSNSDEPSPEAGPQAQAFHSQGTGAGTLAGREERSEGQAASAGLPTNPRAKATAGNAANPTAQAVREPEDEASDGTAGRESQVGGAGPRVSAATSELMDVTGGESAATSIAPDKSAAVAGASSAAPSLRSRIEALHREHPEYTAHQAREALDCKRSSLTAYSAILGIKWASERTAAQEPVQPDPEPEAPEAAPEPERPSVITPEPAIERSPRPLSGLKFYLVNDKGEYLNRFCAGFTSDRRAAWVGNERQLLGCRKNFEIASGLTERAVGKELPPAPINREVA